MNTKPHSKLIERLRARLRELRDANGANVTVTFALATIPMIGFVGAAVDYSHANSVRSAMQAASDATALMLSKEATKMSASEIQTKGNDYFKALFTHPEATDAAAQHQPIPIPTAPRSSSRPAATSRLTSCS